MPKITDMRDMTIKHGALVNFAAGIGQIVNFPWTTSLKLTEKLAELGKPTKDLTLFEVMQALTELSESGECPAGGGWLNTLPDVKRPQGTSEQVIG